jgi:hypothetical protein
MPIRYQDVGAGVPGTKKSTAMEQGGTPGGVINPPAAGMASPGTGPSTSNDWAPLDAAFGNRPLYAVVKALGHKSDNSGFCDHQKLPNGQGVGGMAPKSAAGNPYTPGEVNPDPVTPQEDLPAENQFSPEAASTFEGDAPAVDASAFA